jgi:hypothetical protein
VEIRTGPASVSTGTPAANDATRKANTVVVATAGGDEHGGVKRRDPFELESRELERTAGV